MGILLVYQMTALEQWKTPRVLVYWVRNCKMLVPCIGMGTPIEKIFGEIKSLFWSCFLKYIPLLSQWGCHLCSLKT